MGVRLGELACESVEHAVELEPMQGFEGVSVNMCVYPLYGVSGNNECRGHGCVRQLGQLGFVCQRLMI